MTDRRRAPRTPLTSDDLQVNVRVLGRPLDEAVGRITDASELGFGMVLDQPMHVYIGEQVVVTVRDEGAAERLGVVGVTASCVVRRTPSATELGLEAPDLQTEVRQVFADLVWERSFLAA